MKGDRREGGKEEKSWYREDDTTCIPDTLPESGF
jgi:hypothetical protein